MKVACVGGGPVGLYFSLLLKLQDPGHDVTVLERAPAGAERGWGVTLGQDLLDRMRGCDPASAEALEQAGMCWTRQAVHVGGERSVFDGHRIHNVGRKAMVDILTRRALEAGVRITYDRDVTGLGQLPASDLIVACDGAHSRVRSAVGEFGTSTLLGRNKYIWLGSEAPAEDFSYVFVPTEHGWVWAYAYQFHERASTFIVECSAATWAALHFDTMPAANAVDVLGGLFKEHLGGRRLLGTLPDGTSASWASFPTVSNQRWHHRNIVLAGDSARTAHFSLGQGTKMGLEDAIVLAGSLAREAPLGAALAGYEAQRRAELVRPLSEARCSAEWFENVPRYIGLKPHQFARLLQSRWSPLVRLLPPLVSYRLRQAKDRFAVIHGLADYVGPAAKRLYGWRKPAGPAGAKATLP